MDNTTAYRVLINTEHQTPTVVSIHSLQYAEMVQTGMYTEHFMGTRKECQIEEENLLAEFIGE